MPQSRHRKTNKAKKRPKAPYQGAKPKPAAGSKSNTRIIAIVIVLALAASAVTYLIVSRAGKSNEITTASGLKYTDEVIGTGATPQKGQMISVNYTGTLLNGTKFDSSSDHGKPYQFRVGTGSVIKGWDEGLMSMKVGGKRHLVIPPALGYGNAAQPKIPANSTLVFDVELVSMP